MERLVADLTAAGATVKINGQFQGDPISANGVDLCVGKENVKVYVFGAPAERMAVSGRIDPNDATNVGSAIVEWDGAPKLWARDRIIVVYLGRDIPTTELLMSVLGNTFSHGLDRPQRLPSSCPA